MDYLDEGGETKREQGKKESKQTSKPLLKICGNPVTCVEKVRQPPQDASTARTRREGIHADRYKSY